MGRNQRDSHLVLSGGNIFTGTNESAIVESNASENVTISNVAPAGVATATISKWLKVRVGGDLYYIPMWT